MSSTSHVGPWLKNEYKGSEASGIEGGPKAGREDKVEGNIRTRGKTKTNCFPRDHTLSVYYATSPYTCGKMMFT